MKKINLALKSDIPLQEQLLTTQIKSTTFWLTGLSAAGKSTLAFALKTALIQAKIPCYVLDGDIVREGLCSDLGFSVEERKENIRRVSEVAKLMNDAGLIIIASFISPLKKDRLLARNIIGKESFCEVYVKADLATCEKRDPKGLYAKAKLGAIPHFTGISAPYQEPESPDLTINTINESANVSISKLTQFALNKIDYKYNECRTGNNH